MSVAANLLAVGTDFEFKGVTYHLTPRNIDIEIAFTDWLEKRAIAKLRQHRKVLTPDEFERREQNQQRDFETGLLEFGSARSFEALASPAGLRYMVYLQMVYANPQTVTPALIEEILRDDDKGMELVTTLRRINDPNPPKSEETTTAPTETPSPSPTSSLS